MFNYTSSTLHTWREKKVKTKQLILLGSFPPPPLQTCPQSQRKRGHSLPAKWKQKKSFLGLWGQMPRPWGLEYHSFLPYVMTLGPEPKWKAAPSNALLYAIFSHFSQPSGVDDVTLKNEKGWVVWYVQGHTAGKCSLQSYCWIGMMDQSCGLFCSYSPLLSTSLTLVTFSHLPVSFWH